ETVSSPRMKVLAAIPAFNEEKTIGSVVLGTQRYADEIIVVDDGSTDDTAWIAEQAGATVVRHKVNRGYGAAIRSCFEYARNNGAEILVILDGDGQHRPETIPKVANPVLNGNAEICIGSRFLRKRSAGKVPRYRRFGIGVLTKLTNLGTRHNHKLQDAQSGFRAYSRAAIETLDPHETDMGASTEILWDADKRGLRIVEVPIEIDYDVEGSTKGPLRHGLSVIGSMIRYIETEHALLFFGVPGIVLFVLGLSIGFRVIDSFYQTRELAVGLGLLTVLLLVAGMLLVFTGLILHAVLNATRRLR
ncbi:MAG: glycosyltransferase family 2 protein, partial [Bacteroidota bacterium]